MTETEKLITSKAKEDNYSQIDSLFHPLKASAICISKMLNEMFKLPQYLREGFLTYNMHLLTRKALVLVKYVEAERAQSRVIDQSTQKKLREDLDIPTDTDWFVLLSISEKLCTGTYFALVGSPASLERQFIELFESFLNQFFNYICNS